MTAPIVFSFTASCPRCGGELLTEGWDSKRIADDQVHHDARCDFCLYVFRVTACITVVEPWPIDLADPEVRVERGRENAAYGFAPVEYTI